MLIISFKLIGSQFMM